MAKPVEKKKKRQYDNPYPSVTQVLDVLRKPGLEYWFKVNTPQFIEEKSAKGKEVGNQIHSGITDHIELREIKIETVYVEEVMNALKSFMLFKKEHPEITLHKSEMMMTHDGLKYNGTLDVVAEIKYEDGTPIPVIGDWKTGEAKERDKPQVYDEYKAQLAAYIKAYNHIGKDREPIKMGFIVVLAKDKVAYDLYIMEADEIEAEFNGIFVPALTICNYQRRNVIKKAEDKKNEVRK